MSVATAEYSGTSLPCMVPVSHCITSTNIHIQEEVIHLGGTNNLSMCTNVPLSSDVVCEIGNDVMTSSRTSCEVETNYNDVVLPDIKQDEKEKLIEKRLQPLYELVDSEKTYVSNLKFVAEKYIPLDRVPLSNGPEIPSDLSAKWRIIWGNWLQLTDWHQTFTERLENLQNENAWDDIPKLFIDSKMRLRNNYSKYCENHRKAVLVAEQYRDFFEELRIRIGDKHDVLSHLMKPVQRIMRYQLPMEAIVKITERAGLPSLSQWKRVLDIMKEIPCDTQLILEASRIDDYPGTITSLGKVRIRDELLVATLTPSELQSLQNVIHNFLSVKQSLSPVSDHVNKSCSANVASLNTCETSVSSECASPVVMDSSGVSSYHELIRDMLKFQERRLFLFDQSLLFTEEMKPKKANPFFQSSFQFKSFVNVNKMKFEPHLIGRRVSSDSTNAMDEEEELKFVIYDISPGKECIYIIDPCTQSRREAWILQLRDILTMQQELLLALQYPKMFSDKTGGGVNEPSVTVAMERRSLATGLGGAIHLQEKKDVSYGTWSSKQMKKIKGSPILDSRPRLHNTTDTKSVKNLPINHNSPAIVDGVNECVHRRKGSCPQVVANSENPIAQVLNDGQDFKSVTVTTPGDEEEDPHLDNSSNNKPRTWSGFSFRLPKAKKDLRKANSNLPQDVLFRHHEAPPRTVNISSQSSNSNRKKSGNIFMNLFGKGHKHHKTPSHSVSNSTTGSGAQSPTE